MHPVTGVTVGGEPVDGACRCVHYRSELDVVAIRLACCDVYFPCFRCHDEAVEHARLRWTPAEADERAILCGACGTRLRIRTYRAVTECPECSHAFNPGCRLHEELYFDDRSASAH